MPQVQDSAVSQCSRGRSAAHDVPFVVASQDSAACMCIHTHIHICICRCICICIYIYMFMHFGISHEVCRGILGCALGTVQG